MIAESSFGVLHFFNRAIHTFLSEGSEIFRIGAENERIPGHGIGFFHESGAIVILADIEEPVIMDCDAS